MTECTRECSIDDQGNAQCHDNCPAPPPPECHCDIVSWVQILQDKIDQNKDSFSFDLPTKCLTCSEALDEVSAADDYNCLIGTTGVSCTTSGNCPSPIRQCGCLKIFKFNWVDHLQKNVKLSQNLDVQLDESEFNQHNRDCETVFNYAGLNIDSNDYSCAVGSTGGVCSPSGCTSPKYGCHCEHKNPFWMVDELRATGSVKFNMPFYDQDKCENIFYAAGEFNVECWKMQGKPLPCQGGTSEVGTENCPPPHPSVCQCSRTPGNKYEHRQNHFCNRNLDVNPCFLLNKCVIQKHTKYVSNCPKTCGLISSESYFTENLAEHCSNYINLSRVGKTDKPRYCLNNSKESTCSFSV